jgi:hypothetical protein
MYEVLYWGEGRRGEEGGSPSIAVEVMIYI